MQLPGSCHCRNITFELSLAVVDDEISVRNCGCSFCVKHGGTWTSHPDAELTATVTDWSNVSKYQFGTKTADFYVCKTCGVSPFVVSEIDGKLYAVVSVNAFENIGSMSLSRASTDFDGEDTESRLDRRKRNWIPQVKIS